MLVRGLRRRLMAGVLGTGEINNRGDWSLGGKKLLTTFLEAVGRDEVHLDFDPRLYNSFFPNFPISHARLYQQTASHTFNHNGKLYPARLYALQSLEGRGANNAPSAFVPAIKDLLHFRDNRSQPQLDLNMAKGQ